MDFNIITVIYHKGGRWVNTDSLEYVGGKQVVEKGDIDFLSFTHMIKKYKEKFKMKEVNKLCYLKPGDNSVNSGVLILENNDGINDIVARLLEQNNECPVHIYPFDDCVMKQVINTQCSVANEGSIPDVSLWEDLLLEDLIYEESEGLVVDKSNSEGLVVDKGKRVMYDRDKELDLDLDSGSESDLDGGEGEGDSSVTDSGSNSELEMNLINQSRREVRYESDVGNPHFLLGMTFASAQEARIAIAKYSIAKSTPLKLNPNEKHRIRAKCKSPGCPFVLFMSQSGRNSGLVVNTFHSEHSCLKDSKNRLASARFLASEFKPILNDKPTVTTNELLKTCEQKMHLYVSKSTCKRAKRIVKTELEGSYINEFGYLGAHIAMLKQTNPNTTAELELNEEQMHVGRLVFRRLYICFGALKRGWKAGCRPIIGIDGCHLKGIVKGQVLVAVGKDADNQMFPIAWAVTDKENTKNWKWFIELLVKDLEINDRGSFITIISDVQKLGMA